MNSTQKNIVAGIIVIAAIIIAIAWAEELLVGSWGHWYRLDYINHTWYAFLLPLAGAAFALFKLFENKK